MVRIRLGGYWPVSLIVSLSQSNVISILLVLYIINLISRSEYHSLVPAIF